MIIFYHYLKSVVNNDTAKGWTTIFSQFNNDVSPISSDIREFFSLLNGEKLGPNDNPLFT